MVSEISFPLIPALLIASLAAITPNSVADNPARDPPKLPTAVLTADTMTTSFIWFVFIFVKIGERQIAIGNILSD
jgi:hypothetical protein